MENQLKTKTPHGVVHGRFQPPHNGHIRIMKDALTYVDHLYVGICTPKICTEEESKQSGYPCTEKLNPFSYAERADMISLALLSEGISKENFTCVPFPSDYQNIEAILPKDTVFIMSVTGASDERKIEYLESQGYPTLTIYSLEEGAPRERSGLVREKASAGGADWENLVPESIATYLKEHNLLQKLALGNTVLK